MQENLPSLGFGLGLRTEHYNAILDTKPHVDWFEALSENYMLPGGLPLNFLDRIRADYPVVMHGVSLSIGSTTPFDLTYLKDLKKLADRIQPAWISDHLCWTGAHGVSHHDLLPVPFAPELVELAAELQKPVFLHERDAADRMVAILTKYRPRLAGGVVHCFTGTPETVKRYLGLDLHIGVTGWICDERRGGSLVEAARVIPLDRLMIETDGPFLLPRTLGPEFQKARRNEPAYLPEVVRGLARATGRTEDEIADATTLTARRLFAL